MKNILLAVALVTVALSGYSQSKVFKEVSEDVTSQIKAITQNGNLVGYLVFTELEKASETTFNYKLTIMDENLNDIGTVNFKDEKLLLQQVSFEQDILCLAYIKSNIIGREFKNVRAYNKELESGAKASVFTQFVNLDGKVIGTNSLKVDLKYPSGNTYYTKKNLVGEGRLIHKLILRNIADKGFAMFYGDESSKHMVIYDLAGKQAVNKTIKDKGDEFAMLTSGTDVYLLIKDNYVNSSEGEYNMLAYRTSGSTVLPKYALKDKKGNALKVLAFDNDPVTGKPFVSGNIIKSEGLTYDNAKEMGRGVYAGVFTINFNGTKKSDVTESYSYWNDGSQSTFAKSGLVSDKNEYVRQTISFRDYSGNTYFVGSSVRKRTRWGAIAGAVVTTPLLFGPIFFLGGGTQKSKITDATLIKQNPKGNLSVENNIKGSGSKFYPARTPFYMYDQRTYYAVTNPETKSSYLIFDDNNNITIYNVEQKKVVRTIPHWKGAVETSVFPAKEGHILVAQDNRKEKTRRFSIEAL
jgi:hypothetical protein